MISPQNSPACIGPRQWKHVYRLLGLVLVADRRMVPEETQAFIQNAIALGGIIDPALVVTRRMAKDWLAINKASLISIIDGLEYDTVLIETLGCLNPFPNKRDVLRAMIDIARADNNYSPNKHMFIKKTMIYWNVPLEEEADLANQNLRYMPQHQIAS